MRLWIALGEQGAGDAERMVVLDPARDEHYVGRRAGAEIELPVLTVSLLHARFVRTGGTWFIEDLGSGNGTWKDGVRLPARRPQPLAPGDRLRFGTIEVRVDPTGAELRGEGAGTATLARELVAGLFAGAPAAEPPRLVVVRGPDLGAELVLSLRERPYRVGRAPECELVLSDPDCSRYHAAFVRRDAGLFVVDVGARNGVWLDTLRVAGEGALADGQLVRIGSTSLRVDDPEARYLARMRSEEADSSATPRGAPPDAPPPDAPPPDAPPPDAPPPDAPPPDAPAMPVLASDEHAPQEAAPLRPALPDRARDRSGLVLLAVAVIVLAGLLVVGLWLFL